MTASSSRAGGAWACVARFIGSSSADDAPCPRHLVRRGQPPIADDRCAVDERPLDAAGARDVPRATVGHVVDDFFLVAGDVFVVEYGLVRRQLGREPSTVG